MTESKSPEGATERECPYCKESVKAAAVKCRYCGSRLTPVSSENKGICPFCREEIKPGALKCPHCKSMLDDTTRFDIADAAVIRIMGFSQPGQWAASLISRRFD